MKTLPKGARKEIEGYYEYCITCARWKYHARYEFEDKVSTDSSEPEK